MASMGIDGAKIELLKQFVQLCKFNVSILNEPALAFFKDWLVNDLGANVPELSKPEEKGAGEPEAASYADAAKAESKPTPPPTKTAPPPTHNSSDSEEEEEEEIEELDLDMSGVVAEDTDPPQDMGDDGKEPSEEEQDEAMSLRGKGMTAMSEGNNEEAINLFTQGIKLDNSRTVLFVKRATAYVRLQKPNAAIRDAKKALEINPDSAPAYKVLGKAEKLLGKWDDACRHFEEAQKIDYDDEMVELIRDIKPIATKIREHKMAVERRRKEKELKERIKRVKKAQKAQAKAKAEQEAREKEEMKSGGGPNMFNFAGGMPNFGGAGGGMPENFDFEAFMKKHGGSMGGMGAGGFPGFGGDAGGPSATETPPQPEPTPATEEPKVFEVPTDDLD